MDYIEPIIEINCNYKQVIKPGLNSCFHTFLCNKTLKLIQKYINKQRLFNVNG